MMLTPKLRTIALLGLAWVLASCVVRKAIVVEEQAVVLKKSRKVLEPVVSEPELPALPDDGIRMPDMLGMPGDGDFRSTNPTGQKTGSESGAVISRPPTDPPSRVRPKVAE